MFINYTARFITTFPSGRWTIFFLFATYIIKNWLFFLSWLPVQCFSKKTNIKKWRSSTQGIDEHYTFNREDNINKFLHFGLFRCVRPGIFPQGKNGRLFKLSQFETNENRLMAPNRHVDYWSWNSLSKKNIFTGIVVEENEREMPLSLIGVKVKYLKQKYYNCLTAISEIWEITDKESRWIKKKTTLNMQRDISSKIVSVGERWKEKQKWI